jgi:hypothetical protein
MALLPHRGAGVGQHHQLTQSSLVALVTMTTSGLRRGSQHALLSTETSVAPAYFARLVGHGPVSTSFWAMRGRNVPGRWPTPPRLLRGRTASASRGEIHPEPLAALTADASASEAEARRRAPKSAQTRAWRKCSGTAATCPGDGPGARTLRGGAHVSAHPHGGHPDRSLWQGAAARIQTEDGWLPELGLCFLFVLRRSNG